MGVCYSSLLWGEAAPNFRLLLLPPPLFFPFYLPLFFHFYKHSFFTLPAIWGAGSFSLSYLSLGRIHWWKSLVKKEEWMQELSRVFVPPSALHRTILSNTFSNILSSTILTFSVCFHPQVIACSLESINSRAHFLMLKELPSVKFYGGMGLIWGLVVVLFLISLPALP